MNITAALHLHSTYSYDAKLSLVELKAVLQARGVKCALMTEHTDEMTFDKSRLFIEECAALSDDTFLFVPGFEISYRDTHILAPGCTTFIAQHATEIELYEWRTHAPLMILAHPHRNGYHDRAPAGVIDGIEIWNAQYDGKVVPRTGARRLFDRFAAHTPEFFAFAGWDFHRAAHAGGPTIALDVSTLTTDAVLAALRTGAYTLRSSVVEVSSRGVLMSGDPQWVRAMSFVYVHVIRIAKVVNRVLAALGLKLPSSFVASIRKRL
jgi:hypothetical protein